MCLAMASLTAARVRTVAPSTVSGSKVNDFSVTVKKYLFFLSHPKEKSQNNENAPNCCHNLHNLMSPRQLKHFALSNIRVNSTFSQKKKHH